MKIMTGKLITLFSVITLVSCFSYSSKNHSLSEECNHSDWYEAKMDLERNLAADLADSRENFLTKLALKSPEVSMMNYSGLKTVGFIGAEASERTLHTPIASQFLKYSLAGSGKPLSFAYGSDVSTDLENSEILATKVKELARNMKPGEKKYFYSDEFLCEKRLLENTKSIKVLTKLANSKFDEIKLKVIIHPNTNFNILDKLSKIVTS